MKTLAIGLFSMLVVMGMLITQSQAASPSLVEPVFAKFIGGTIEEIDPAALRVTI